MWNYFKFEPVAQEEMLFKRFFSGALTVLVFSGVEPVIPLW